MAQWGEAARRGQLDLDLATRARAVEDGFKLHPKAAYIGILRSLADDLDDCVMSFDSFARVGAFLREMEPRQFHVFTAAGEDADELFEAFRAYHMVNAHEQ